MDYIIDDFCTSCCLQALWRRVEGTSGSDQTSSQLHETIALNGINNLFQVVPFRLVAFGGLEGRIVALWPVCVCVCDTGFQSLVQEIQCPIFLQVLLQAGCILEPSGWMVCFSLCLGTRKRFISSCIYTLIDIQ